MDIIARDNDLAQIISDHADEPGGLLPLLHSVQQAFGHVSPAFVPRIAEGMGLSRAEVHGVISFYHEFRTQPAGRHILQICRAEACQAMGAHALEAHAMARLGVGFGETTVDGMITLEAVYCLGNCACPPSLRIDDTIHARVDAERFDELLDPLVAERMP